MRSWGATSRIETVALSANTYRSYIHWGPLITGLLLLLVSGALGLVVVRSQLPPVEWGARAKPGNPTEQVELREPLRNTITVRAGHIVARNGRPLPPDSILPYTPERLSRPAPLWPGQNDWYSTLTAGCFSILLGMLGLLALHRVSRARFTANFSEWAMDLGQSEALLRIENEQLRLVRPYPFLASLLAERTSVAAHELTAIGADGQQAVLAGREILFFTFNQKPDLLAFAHRHGIPLTQLLNPWPALAAPLSSEYDADDEAPRLARLQAMGISPAEVRQLRWRLWWWRAVQPWYWLNSSEEDFYLDHREVLYLTGAALLPQRRWYWRTMELALRPPNGEEL